jgi:dihydroxyacetone kinase
VIVQRDWTKEKAENTVAIISGGGSGHEPSHAGWVGEGMLTAAVCGDIFASPSVDAVYAAIKHCAGSAGVLLIVKNYTGDRVNFGLAAERAKAEGIKVEMVVVADDVALPPKKSGVGPRGLAGTALVHRWAGSQASTLPLADLREQTQALADNTRTIGLAMTACNLPGQARNTRLDGDSTIELGLGIHGEPGVETLTTVEPSKALVKRMLDKIVTYNDEPLQAGDNVILMVNDLGNSTNMEVGVITTDAVAYLTAKDIKIRRVYAGAFMTALDMNGVSLTVLKLPAQKQGQGGPLALHFDTPTDAFAWPADKGSSSRRAMRDALELIKPSDVHGCITAATTFPLPDGLQTSEISYTAPLTPSGSAVQRAVEKAAFLLTKTEKPLNDLDALVGDGDCGSTHKKGAKAILAQSKAQKFDYNTVAATFGSLSTTLQTSMGGSSGAMYALFLSAAGNALATDEKDLSGAFGAGVAAIQRYGGAGLGDRTMLDALIPAHTEFKRALAEDNVDQLSAFRKAVIAAEQGALATENLTANFGRSSYVPADKQKGVYDPGAIAVAVALRGVYNALAEEDTKALQ